MKKRTRMGGTVALLVLMALVATLAPARADAAVVTRVVEVRLYHGVSTAGYEDARAMALAQLHAEYPRWRILGTRVVDQDLTTGPGGTTVYSVVLEATVIAFSVS